MIVKRLIAAAIVLCLGSALGSCGGASENGFSSFVADHWPHWAGGMPADVPPRPGEPGYAEFIAHGQADQNATQPPADRRDRRNGDRRCEDRRATAARGAGRTRRQSAVRRTKRGAGRALLAASRHAGAQQIVEMHDADRPIRFHDDERGDFR